VYGSLLSASTAYIINPERKCNNQLFTYTSNITGTTYQWQVDRNDGLGFVNLTNDFFHSGVSTRTLNIVFALDNWQGYKYRCLVDGVNYSRTFEMLYETYWTGAIDDRWENPGNWSCSTIPGPNMNVVIGSGNVVLHTNTVIRSIKIIAGASFTIDTGYQLTVLH
jgi:hypothetical protein